MPDSFEGYTYNFTYDEFGVRVRNVCIYDAESDKPVPSITITYQDIPKICKQLNNMYDAWRHVLDVE